MTRKHLPGSGKKVRVLVAAATVAMAAAACDPGESLLPETAHVQVLLTDAPTDMLASTQVWISRVYLQGGGGEEPDTADTGDTGSASDRVDLFNDPDNPLVYDLLQLQDGLTADLTGPVEVDAGLYQGLRFVVDSATVTLADGLTFADGSTTSVLKVPSGSQSGIKVKLDDILRANADEEIEVVVDFDVDANFVVQLNGQTGLVNKVLFTPVLKEKDRSTAPSDN